MRVRVVLLLCIASVGALALFNASWRVVSSLRERAALNQSQQAWDTLWAGIELTGAMAREREMILARWVDPGPTPVTAKLELLAEPAFERVIAGPDAHLAAKVIQFPPDVGALLRTRDATVIAERLPREARPPELIGSYLAKSTGLERAFTTIGEILAHEVTLRSPEHGSLARLTYLAQMAGSAEAIRRSTVSLQFLDQNVYRASLLRLRDREARRTFIWEQLKLTLADWENHPAFRSLIQQISSQIDGPVNAADLSLIDSLLKGDTPSLPMDRYVSSREPIITALTSLRNAAHDEFQARLTADQRGKLLELAFALLSAITAIAITAMASWMVLRRVAQPLSELTWAVTRIAQNDLQTPVPGGDRRDELGDLARAILILQERSAEAQRLRQAAAADQQRKLEAARLLTDAARTFEQGTAAELVNVHAEGDTLKQVVTTLIECGRRAKLCSRGAIGDVTQAAERVNALAMAVETVVATARTVSGRMARAGTVANGAATEATSALSHIDELTQMAGRVGKMVDAIAKIANRTKLLSLNATIEATRAGAAGRGFAVVASEVKSLAGQTALATEEVAGHVTAIQLATGRASSGIQTLVAHVGALSEAAAAVAAAVEEQEAATSQIALAAQTAAAGTTQAATQVLDSERSGDNARSVSAKLPGLADKITTATAALSSEIHRFLGAVREAA